MNKSFISFEMLKPPFSQLNFTLINQWKHVKVKSVCLAKGGGVHLIDKSYSDGWEATERQKGSRETVTIYTTKECVTVKNQITR